MSDREQAIKDVADFCGLSIQAVAGRMTNRSSTGYAVSQRERVIALERALREIRSEALQRYGSLDRDFLRLDKIASLSDAALRDR